MGGGILATCIAPRAFSQRMNLLRRENTVHSKTMGAGWEVGSFKPPPSIGDTEGCVQSRYASLHSIKKMTSFVFALKKTNLVHQNRDYVCRHNRKDAMLVGISHG